MATDPDGATIGVLVGECGGGGNPIPLPDMGGIGEVQGRDISEDGAEADVRMRPHREALNLEYDYWFDSRGDMYLPTPVQECQGDILEPTGWEKPNGQR
jgi:hypothetical protein